MLDDRKAAILRAVVAEYIETAQPVGSSHVASAPSVQVSSATVRNEMAALERDGYLVQPHTSAGRIPTDKGYRFFVDQIADRGHLGPKQHQLVQDFFTQASGELEQMLHDTSRLLSGLTDYASVVVAPAHDEALVRSVQIVRLHPTMALLVAVLSNGVIEKRSLEISETVSDDDLAKVTAALSELAIGSPLNRIATAKPTGTNIDSLVAAARTALALDEHDAGLAFVGGATHMASSFEAVETVRRVLTVLEQQYVLVSLARQMVDSGMSVAIGTEHGVVPLAECAIVIAPYTVDGERRGTIGVLGPTRMNYPRALAAVEAVGERLSERLSDS